MRRPLVIPPRPGRRPVTAGPGAPTGLIAAAAGVLAARPRRNLPPAGRPGPDRLPWPPPWDAPCPAPRRRPGPSYVTRRIGERVLLLPARALAAWDGGIGVLLLLKSNTRTIWEVRFGRNLSRGAEPAACHRRPPSSSGLLAAAATELRRPWPDDMWRTTSPSPWSASRSTGTLGGLFPRTARCKRCSTPAAVGADTPPRAANKAGVVDARGGPRSRGARRPGAVNGAPPAGSPANKAASSPPRCSHGEVAR